MNIIGLLLITPLSILAIGVFLAILGRKGIWSDLDKSAGNILVFATAIWLFIIGITTFLI